jgi:hypothetical protein
MDVTRDSGVVNHSGEVRGYPNPIIADTIAAHIS